MATTQRFTREEWHAVKDDWALSLYGLASDYGLLAFALLDGTRIEPQAVEVLGAHPEPQHVTIRVDCGCLTHDLAAVQLLREYWLSEWFPVNTITHIEAADVFSAALEHALATR